MSEYESTGQLRADEASGRTDQDFDWSRVLARIPDVRRHRQHRSSGKRSRGQSIERLLSQQLSVKILMGGAALLLGVAVLPFLFGGRGSDNPAPAENSAGQPAPPAPAADAAPNWVPGPIASPAGPVEVASGTGQSG